MLSKQEEERERRETLRNDQRVLGIVAQGKPLTPEQRAALEKKIDEAKKQGSTMLDHTHSETGGRWSAVGAQTVVSKAGDPWPTMPEGNPWRGPDPCGQERSFGQQLTEFGVSQTSVPERKR
jgi:hypothetical protein